MGYDGTPTQICTCSSDFLFRRMILGDNFRWSAVEAVVLRLHLGEVFAHQLHEVIVVQMSGGGDDYVAGDKALAIKIPDWIALEALDRVAGAENRAAQRVVFPEILSEDFMDQVVGTVLVHFDFFEDDAALADNVVGGESGIQNQVAEHVERDRQMFVEHLDAEADALFGGEGVNVSADGIHLARNFFGGAMLGPLEHHVLDEVRNAVPLFVFVARAGLDPDADADGANVLHLLGDDGQSVGQRGAPDIAVLIHCHYSHTPRTLCSAAAKYQKNRNLASNQRVLDENLF